MRRVFFVGAFLGCASLCGAGCATGPRPPLEISGERKAYRAGPFESVLNQDAQSVWSGGTAGRTRVAVQNFLDARVLGPEKGESTLVYGASVRALDLRNKTFTVLSEMMARKKFVRLDEVQNDPVGKSVPMILFIHADYGVVRVVKGGSNSYTTKGVMYENSTTHEWTDLAFGVDNFGNPIPKGISDLAVPALVENDPEQREAYLLNWANQIQTQLPD